jgi:hypothetical protein
MAAVVNARSLFGRISGTFIAEYLQVSTKSTIDGNYYYAELSEAPGDFPDVPANIIVSTSGDRTVTTAHLKRRTGGSVGPQKGEYRLESQRVYFPASQAGLSYWFFYYGIGDYIKAEDINQLDTRVTTLEQGGMSPVGNQGDIQFNNDPVLGASSLLNWDIVNDRLTIGGLARLRILNGASAGKVLTSDATGDASWQDASGTIIPADPDGSVQFNDSGDLGGSSQFMWNSGTNVLTLGASSGLVLLFGSPGSNKVLTSDGTGNASWQDSQATVPGGSDEQIQFNNNGVFAGSSSIQYTIGTNTTTITDNLRLNVTTPTVGRFLRCSNVNGAVEWADLPVTTPGGSDSQVQFNDGGSFTGAANLTYSVTRTTIGGSFRILGGSPAANRFLMSTNASGDVTWSDLPTGLTPGGSADTVQTNDGAGGLSGNTNLTFDGTVLDLNGTLRYTDGNEGAGKYLQSDASGNASWQTIPSVLLPGGSNGNIQFKDSGDVFVGSANLHWNNSSNLLLVVGSFQYQNGNHGLGKLLTSSGAGVGDWIEPAWVISGSDISFGYSGVVNIGSFSTLPTTTPKFNVDGRVVCTNDIFVMNNAKSVTANLCQTDVTTEYYIPPTTGGLPTGVGNILAYSITQADGFDIELNTTVRRLDVDTGISDGGIRVGNPTANVGNMHINTLANDSDSGFIKNSILMSRDGDFTFDLGTNMWTIGNTSGSNDFAAILNRAASLAFCVGVAGAFTSISNADFRDDHEMLTITPTGVGVNGTISPSVSLEVNGETRLQDLRIDNGSAGGGKILSSANSNGDTVWIDPLTSSGSSGDIQFSDGLGEFSSSSNLRWVSASSTLASSGNLSVGKTTAPSLFSGSSNNSIEIESSSNPGVIFTSTTPSDNQVFLHYNSVANNFQLYNTNTSTTLFSVDNFGRFSLGASVPVSSYISGARNFVIEDTTSFCGMTLGSSSSFGTQILFSNTANRGSVLGSIQYFNNTNHLEFTSNGTEAMRCNNAQEVVMTTRVVTPALRVTASPSAGHVLTSDASGNATWQVPTGSGYNPGTWTSQSTPTGWSGTILWRYDSTRGVVEFQSGSIQYNSGAQTTLMTLPAGQRPFFQQFIQLRDQTTGSDLDMVVVNTDGTVVAKTFPEIGNNLTIQGVIYTNIV